jgi:hypothetical protein
MKRTRKNRKKQSQGFAFPIPLTIFLVMTTVFSMCYLLMTANIEASGVTIQQLERQREESRQRLLREQAKWNSQRSLANVLAAVERHNLQMTWPREEQIVRLRRPAIQPVEVAETLYEELAQLSGPPHE